MGADLAGVSDQEGEHVELFGGELDGRASQGCCSLDGIVNLTPLVWSTLSQLPLAVRLGLTRHEGPHLSCLGEAGSLPLVGRARGPLYDG